MQAIPPLAASGQIALTNINITQLSIRLNSRIRMIRPKETWENENYM